MRFAVPTLALVLLAGCAPAGDDQEAQEAAGPASLRPEAPATADGSWHYSPGRAETGSSALFGPPGGEAEMMVRCNAGEGSVELVSYEHSERPGWTHELLGVGERQLRLPVRLERYEYGDQPLWSSIVAFPADHALAEELARSGGPIRLAVEGGGSGALPAHRLVGRVVQECRRLAAAR